MNANIQRIFDDRDRAVHLAHKLSDFAERNWATPSLEDLDQRRELYVIAYDTRRNDLVVEPRLYDFTELGASMLYFSKKKVAEEAIKEFRDELFWYFTGSRIWVL